MAALALGMTLAAGSAQSAVIIPTDDSQVIEVLPGATSARREDRRLRQRWSAHPDNPALAVALAERYLERSRELADPRLAGQALAVLKAWPDAQSAPDDVLLMLATLQQYLHDFDASAANLERLVRRNPSAVQAWLILGTVRRVQGGLDASQRACAGLDAAGAPFQARACFAENAGLRGDYDASRNTFTALLATPGLAPQVRAWLLTSLAELEMRAGRGPAAETAFRQSLRVHDHAYTRLAFVDHLMNQRRDAEALTWLKDQPRNDAVLLRLAIAGTRGNSAQGSADASEMRQRFAQANLRPQARGTHAREQAMFALWVDSQPQRALELARNNVRRQREPTDVLVFAQAARAVGSRAALGEIATLCNEIGLHDRRIEQLL